jgi:hypothetical protein
MVPDRMQTQRFELKYLISERIALAIRDFVSSYLEIDEYGVGCPNLSYPVHSLYLDSQDLYTHQQTINGTKNRFKLRLRYYDNNPGTPVFFEIKRRMNNSILKQRGGVRRDAVKWLLAGHLPEPEHVVSREPKHLVALQRFNLLMSQIQAHPKAHVYYFREAWTSRDDNSVRVTVDRGMHCVPCFTGELETAMTGQMPTYGQGVILELKFTNYFPNWFKELVRIYGLIQRSAAKYSEGITVVGEHRFLRSPTGMEPAESPAVRLEHTPPEGKGQRFEARERVIA